MASTLDLIFAGNDQGPREPFNVLPHDGEALYYGPIFGREEADRRLRALLGETPWKNDEVAIYGKVHVTDRKIAWYGDSDYAYRYSNKTRVALPWTPELLEIKAAVERATGETYNSCLLNLYEHGKQGMGWHHDDEKELEPGSSIASVTFGAERRFDFRHDRTKEKASVVLEHGALLVMKGATQENWKHQVPKAAKVGEPRINLTFRNMLG